MRKFFGTVLILGGVLSLVDYMIWGSLNAGIPGASTHLLLPLLSSGIDYPNQVMKLCFGIGLFTFGLYLVLLEGDMNRAPLALIFMVNSLLLCFALIVAFAAFHAPPEKQAWVGIASAWALLHVVAGCVLLYLAATERPVGTAGLSIGSVIFVSSAAVGAIVYLNGKAA